MSTLGIDVSNNNGSIDWSAVAHAGKSFSLAKASEGLTFVDSYYNLNRVGAVSHGLAHGGYHFARATEGWGHIQAAHLLEHLHPEPWHLVPMLDLEEIGSEGIGASELEEFCFRFGQNIRISLGIKALLLYTDLNMLRFRLKVTRRLQQSFLLDLAQWGPGPPRPPRGWRLALHQYSGGGSCPGVRSQVDLDRAVVPLEQLTIEALRVARPAPVSAPKPYLPTWLAGGGRLLL